MKFNNYLKLFLVILMFPLTSMAQKDKVGSKDHPLFQRFKQSYIYDYEVTSFDSYTIAMGKEVNSKLSTKKEVEGKVFKIFYSLPTDAGSTYEIYSNYLNALKSQGASILFSCKKVSECGKYFWGALGDANKYLMPAYYGEELAYIAAKFSKDGMTYYVAIVAGYGLSEQGYEIHVIETKEMNQQINMDGIEKALDKDGKIALYGIYFDTGKSMIKSGSEQELNEVVNFLKKNSSVKLYVVGHTDDVGNFDSNMTLSKARATAVVNYLVSKGISSSRLKAVGDGPTAPVASNGTDAGKQKNRRVELVKRLN